MRWSCTIPVPSWKGRISVAFSQRDEEKRLAEMREGMPGNHSFRIPKEDDDPARHTFIASRLPDILDRHSEADDEP